MAQTTSAKKIGLIGPFGYGNLGDAAIQEAMIQHILLNMPDAEIIGFSLNPEDTTARHGIKSYPISRMSWKDNHNSPKNPGVFARFRAMLNSSTSPTLRNLERWISRAPLELGLWLQAYRNLKDIDALIVSGGGQLDDYWGGGGPWSHPYTLLKWGLLTKVRGGKFYFVSVGAGPIDARLSQRFIKYALTVADYRSYRDQYSRDLIEKIGFRKADPVYPDLAHSLIINRPTGNGRHSSRPLVGIGLVGYYKPGCWPEHDQVTYDRYLGKLTAFVSWLLERQYAVIFLPGEAHYDALAIADLIKALKSAGASFQNDQLIEASINTLDDLLNQLTHTDFIVGSRFHNILLAQTFEKPVLAISYQAKIDSLMADSGQGAYCVPIDAFELDQIKDLFIGLETDYKAIQKQLSGRTQEKMKALEQQYEQIFAEI
jgi:polysaccharide pyruvyl transferase WcaK-like protein